MNYFSKCSILILILQILIAFLTVSSKFAASALWQTIVSQCQHDWASCLPPHYWIFLMSLCLSVLLEGGGRRAVLTDLSVMIHYTDVRILRCSATRLPGLESSVSLCLRCIKSLSLLECYEYTLTLHTLARNLEEMLHNFIYFHLDLLSSMLLKTKTKNYT